MPSPPKHHRHEEITHWLEQTLLREREFAASQLERRHQRMISDLSKQLSSVAISTSDLSTPQSISIEGPDAKQQLGVASVQSSKPTTNFSLKSALNELPKPNPKKPVFASKKSLQAEGPGTLFQKYVKVVNSPAFEAAFAAVIVCSAIILGVEMQYRGLETGHQVGYPSYTKPATEVWPWAVQVFEVADCVLGILFTVELLLKLMAQGKHFFCEFWNWIDILIVSSWFGSQGGSSLNPLILRVFRLMRLLRLLRLLGMISAFDSLYLMVTAIKGSLLFLVWAVLVLCVAEVIFACLLQASVENFLREGNRSQKAADVVYMHFGTFARSMLSMFELTLGNWLPPTRALVENVSEWYLLFCLMHKFIIGFSVVSVITGVFIQETFKVATTDDQIMINTKKRAIKDHEKKMSKLFRHADRDGNGSLCRGEFDKVMDDAIVRKWLSSMGLEVNDVDKVFETLNGGDGKVTAHELVVGASRLKGNARSIDLLTFITEYRHDRALIMQHFRQMDPEQFGNHNTTITGSEAHSASNLWCKVI